MKKLLYLPFVFCLTFCNCKKDLSSKTVSNTITSITSQCPENGICTIELLKNKELNVKTDEFGSTYFTLIDNPKTSVIQYQYNRNVEKGLQDAQHKEQILFEINNDISNLNLQNEDLQKTKMLFGRLCFCRGQTGHYKVINGDLKLNKNNDVYAVDLNFKIDQVPQLYTTVKATVK